MAVDPRSIDPIGADNGPGTGDHKTFSGPKPPADTLRTHDAGLQAKAFDALATDQDTPGYHPIPGRDMWDYSPRTPGEEFNMPFGRSDSDWDDAVTSQV